MRGGSSSCLWLADDGNHYVVKRVTNPQGAHILINEMLCYELLKHLNLPVPHYELIKIGGEVLASSTELAVRGDCRTDASLLDVHFGSRYPVNPESEAVYDYLPDRLLKGVINRRAFLGMVAFDKWVCNADARQAIFFKGRASKYHSADSLWPGIEPRPQSLVFVAQMIDHGFAFYSHHWKFVDDPEIGCRPSFGPFAAVRGCQDFEPWLGRIKELSPRIIEDASRRIPPEWFCGEWSRPRFDTLLERLYERRTRVPELVRQGKFGGNERFPNWKSTVPCNVQRGVRASAPLGAKATCSAVSCSTLTEWGCRPV